MAEISREDVLKLARLTRLSLTDDEVVHYQQEFAEILEYIKMLEQVDITGLQPTTQVTGLTNVTREDVIKGYGYEPLDLLKNAPNKQGELLKVRRMIG